MGTLSVDVREETSITKVCTGRETNKRVSTAVVRRAPFPGRRAASLNVALLPFFLGTEVALLPLGYYCKEKAPFSDYRKNPS